jgi:hypothetical protein
VSDGPYPSPDEITAANAGLVAIVRRQLPQRFYGGESYWAVFRAAALLRMADTVEGLMRLMDSRHDLEGQTLVRSLYEQVVTFAWIAIDPETGYRRWVGDGTSAELKLHNDAVQFGESILTPAQVARAKAYLGLSAGRDKPDPARGSAARHQPSTGGRRALVDTHQWATSDWTPPQSQRSVSRGVSNR